MKNKRILFKITIVVVIIIIILLFIYLKSYSKERVIISKDSCSIVEDSLHITMKTKKGYKIYYTLDGSIPTKKSIRYKKDITLNRYSSPDQLVLNENKELMVHNGIYIDDNIPRGTVLRAVSIAPNGTAGPIETRTYFIGTDISDYYNNIAVFSLVTDPKNLLDYNTGILVKGKIYDKWSKTKEGKKILKDNASYLIKGNFTQKGKEWEREATIELFDGTNTSTFKDNVGIRIKGNQTRLYSQKSFNIYFREDYGNKNLKYELFSDSKDIDGKTINKYRKFTLRNGGNDTEFLKYKDQLLQDLVKDRQVDTQSGRLAILFINGEYWGIYNLQEKYSDLYYSEHYKLDKDNIVVIKENEVEEGIEEDIKLYDELMEYSKKDLRDDKTYNEFKNIVDIYSMLDYYAIETYIANADWGEEDGILKNTQLWRVRTSDNSKYGDGKWRWSLYDLEYSSTLYGQKNTNVNYNTIKQALDRHPLFKSAMNNNEFKEAFYNTLKEIGKNNFDSEKVNDILDNYEDSWSKYMSDYYRRFGDNSLQRDNSLVATKYFFNKRYDIITNY